MKKAKVKQEETYKLLEFFKKYYYIFFMILMAVILFNCFYHLGQFPARDWDEARHGVSAYEMLKNRNYIVNTYAYETDYWNLKPPLSFWGIILGYKIFGYSLFAMRFYSALSFALTALLTALFALKRYGKVESLMITLLISCCSPFYRFHFARHGDSDALFMLFVVISILSAMLIKEHPKFLYLCGFSFSLAFLTKSWHSLIIVAIVGMYFIVSKLLFKLSWKQWLLFLLSALGPVLLWLIVRYQYDGLIFLQNMLSTDLFNRVSQPLEGHTGGFFYYIQLMFMMSLTTGLLPLCLTLYYGSLKVIGARDAFSRMNPNFKNDSAVYLLWIFVPLILFSFAQTKISWYAIPIFFALVVFSGLFLVQALNSPRVFRVFQIGMSAVLVLIVILSYFTTWNEIKPAYQDSLQPYLAENLAKHENIKGKNAYLETDGLIAPLTWDQSYLLVSELYLDLKCKSGGLQEFLKNPKGSILIISADKYNQSANALNGYKIISRNEDYLCLSR